MEILDRLSGIAVVKEQLSITAKNVDKLGDWLIEHERRISALEGASKTIALTATQTKTPKKK